MEPLELCGYYYLKVNECIVSQDFYHGCFVGIIGPMLGSLFMFLLLVSWLFTSTILKETFSTLKEY